MNLFCKLSLHRYKDVKRLSGGDYPKYKQRCSRCGKSAIAVYNVLGSPRFIVRITEED